MLADDGVDNLNDTQVWKTLTNESCEFGGSCPTEFVEGLKKYFNIAKYDLSWGDTLYQIESLNGNLEPQEVNEHIVFADGMIIDDMYCFLSEEMACQYLQIDVNGQKKPNKKGRDVFGFLVTNEGKLYPYNSRAEADLYIKLGSPLNAKYWRDDPEYCGTPSKKDAEQKADGSGCAARIIENGWTMDY